VIDGDDREPFFLAVEAGTMTLGDKLPSAEAFLRDLRITRIRCEIEVDDSPVVVSDPTNEEGPPRCYELHPGEEFQVGHSRLRLEASADDSPPPAETLVLPPDVDSADMPSLRDDARPEEPAAPPPTDEPAAPAMRKRFVVIDGADQGHTFLLPESGTTTIGQSHKNAEIVLHDLYVSRVHCEVHLDGDQVVVKHVSGQHGSLLNGKPITREQIRPGDVLRVGNSHLRLDLVSVEDLAAENKEDKAEEDGFEVLEEEAGFEVVEDEVVEAEVVEVEDSDEPTALPHSPIDELVELEHQTLGHFKIATMLGRGHSGMVFRALDTRTNHTVALKVLSPDFPASEAELHRFARALKLVPQLNHPHLVHLHGVGKSGAHCWISREYVEGESVARLIQRIKQGDRLKWTRACRVALDLGKVLHFLHGHRVTHGNITPRNILIRHEDRSAKLADLMLNQALEGSALQKAILGKKLLAELAYLPPEQSDPHDRVSTTADIYSLGSVVYALLTGLPPFRGDTPRELRAQIRAGKLIRPSRIQRGIPPEFEAIVLKMLAREPEDRFASAAELVTEVESVAVDHGIED
jgi:pSer/pThr/pTyr-binding forkhead associated (FHA) protein